MRPDERSELDEIVYQDAWGWEGWKWREMVADGVPLDEINRERAKLKLGPCDASGWPMATRSKPDA